jgi:hypothetical protein
MGIYTRSSNKLSLLLRLNESGRLQSYEANDGSHCRSTYLWIPPIAGCATLLATAAIAANAISKSFLNEAKVCDVHIAG